MARLRDPDTGCPWDVEQDFSSIAPFTIEEAYEVADAIERSDIADAFPGVNLDGLQAGIWGSPAERNRLLREGDRVELYRPLAMDPREARRLKAGV